VSSDDNEATPEGPAKKAPVDSLGWRLAEDGLWYPPAPGGAADVEGGEGGELTDAERAAAAQAATSPWAPSMARTGPPKWAIALGVIVAVGALVAVLLVLHNNSSKATLPPPVTGLGPTTTTAGTTSSSTTTTVAGTAGLTTPTSAQLCRYLALDTSGVAKANGLNGAFTLNQYAASSSSGGAADVARLRTDGFVRGCSLTATLPAGGATLGVLVMEFRDHLAASDYAHFSINWWSDQDQGV